MHAGYLFSGALDIVRRRVFKLKIGIVFLKGSHKVFPPHDVGELAEVQGSFGIGVDAVGHVVIVAICMGCSRLLFARTHQIPVRAISARPGIYLIFFIKLIFKKIRNKGSKPFIHPGVFALVGRQNMLEP